ncbi:MAG: glycosyltransferase [Patescibacteria group bacterium]
MKSFKVSKIRWANYGDLELPYFRSWNFENRLPKGFWQRIWEYPFVLLNLPQTEPSLDVGGTYPFVLFKHFLKAISLDIRDLNQLNHPLHKGLWPKEKLVIGNAMQMPFKNNEFRYSFSISAIEEMPDPLKALQEMIRVSSERVVLTMDVSDKLGVSNEKLKEILDYLGIKLPEKPKDIMSSADPRQRHYRQKPLAEFSEIRVLGLVIDKFEPIKDCGILIPHSESMEFLKICVNQIRKMANPKIKQHIYIIDDNSQDGSFEKIIKQYGKDPNIVVAQIKRKNFNIPDVGQVLDEGLKLVTEQFVCMIDADLFPMSKNWLAYPIWLLEKYNASSVGSDTCLSLGYTKKLPENWKNKEDYLPDFGLFDNDNFTCINNFFRIMRAADAKVVSEKVGFRRFQSCLNWILDKTINKVFGRYRWLYFDFPQADNGVRANYFIDANRLGPKFALPIINFLGITPQDGIFGQNVCNLVMHFALSSRALSISHKEINDVGDSYLSYIRRLFNDHSVLADFFRQVQMDNHREISKQRFYQWYLDQAKKLEASFVEYQEQNA